MSGSFHCCFSDAGLDRTDRGWFTETLEADSMRWLMLSPGVKGQAVEVARPVPEAAGFLSWQIECQVLKIQFLKFLSACQVRRRN